MELNLQNVKGTKDYMPEEQYTRNMIKNTLENVFLRYGCKPLETPILNYYEVMAEAELMEMAIDIFNELKLDVYKYTIKKIKRVRTPVRKAHSFRCGMDSILV